MTAAREKFEGSGKVELSVATIGIIAGSIIVPSLAAKASAAKSAIAGWGGVAGAANAAQYTLQQKGVSASRVAATYEETRREIKASAQAYAAATTNLQRAKAITSLSIACRYPQLPGADAPAPPASGAGG
jgi:shikimate 5-dehydrogenase